LHRNPKASRVCTVGQMLTFATGAITYRYLTRRAQN
jgi:hypothetical protein